MVLFFGCGLLLTALAVIGVAVCLFSISVLFYLVEF